MVVSKDTNIKLVYNVIRMFRFITLRACLHGGGRPKVGQVTHLGGVTRLSTLAYGHPTYHAKRVQIHSSCSTAFKFLCNYQNQRKTQQAQHFYQDLVS